MNRSDIKLWHIYFAPNCRHAKPQPKDKYVVIVYIDKNPMGFFINTRISNYILNKPHLLVCEAVIQANEHKILRYDSYVDCQKIYEFEDKELERRFDSMSDPAKLAILYAIRDCVTVEQVYKDLILEDEKSFLAKNNQKTETDNSVD